jgi:hypothetical protein
MSLFCRRPARSGDEDKCEGHLKEGITRSYDKNHTSVEWKGPGLVLYVKVWIMGVNTGAVMKHIDRVSTVTVHHPV